MRDKRNTDKIRDKREEKKKKRERRDREKQNFIECENVEMTPKNKFLHDLPTKLRLLAR